MQQLQEAILYDLGKEMPLPSFASRQQARAPWSVHLTTPSKSLVAISHIRSTSAMKCLKDTLRAAWKVKTSDSSANSIALLAPSNHHFYLTYASFSPRN